MAHARNGLISRFKREIDPDGEMEKRSPEMFARQLQERISAHYAHIRHQGLKNARLKREAEQKARARGAGAAVAPAAPASETTRRSPKESR